MITTVAVLSDIHGVLPALLAVLAEPEVQAADRVVLTGDVAAGPQPVEVLDALAGLGSRAVWVRGNADRELAALARGTELDSPDAISPWAAAQLRPDQVELLATLPYPVTLEVDGFGPVLFCHGTPRDDNEVVLVDTRLVINPGSVGMPYGRAGAHWALLAGGEARLRRTDLDLDDVCARIADDSGYRDAAAWADEYVRARNSDADAIAAFGPRDGRVDRT